MNYLMLVVEGLENVGRFWDMGSWEMSLLLWFNSLHGTFVDYVVLIITLLGDKGIVWITSGIIMLLFKKTRRMGIYVIITYALVGGMNNYGIKLLTDRSRPFYDNTIAVYPGAQALQDFAVSIFYGDGLILGFAEIPDSTSFFSGHTVASIACATMILLHNRKWGIPAIILASLIALSRLWLGVHWPTDVLFGAIFAVAATIGLYYLLRFLEPKVVAWLTKIFHHKDPKTAQ
ncbi:MAG: phosphatase PAP2 family protein [Bacteroidia bacterium]|nr:phosphatase PAP2 family protein [Bacteroidia bacterium]